MSRTDTARRRDRARRLRRRIRRPPAHWGVLGLCLGALMLALLVQGFSTRTIGASATGGPGGDDAPLAGRGPVLADRDGHLATRAGRPGKRLALTFDDGPDPRWTPRIAATLKRLHVPATFFMVGGEAARHAGIVRRLAADGFELGNHTFTHADVAAARPWQRRYQVELTDSVIAGITGRRSRLFRPPYSSTPNAVTTPQRRAYAELTRRGYLVVLSDLDGRDWERPGVGRIVEAATPRGGRGGIVLLHDGGGDRAQTLAALPRIVARARARGFRFVTATDVAGIPRPAVTVATTEGQQVRGRLLLAALTVARLLTDTLTAILIPVALLMLLRALILVVLARRHATAARRRKDDPAPFAPPVSVLVPAFNEAVGIERAVRSLAASEHPDVEIIVVDDGSADGTAELVEALALPRVRLVRQANAGKAEALNRGVREARHDVLVMVDADTVFEPETLLRLVAPLRDEHVGAVAGNTKVGNRRGLLGRWQHIEYVMGFNLDRRLYDLLRCMPTVPGAIGAFRRAALADAGGLSTATLAEDTDLTIAIGRAGWHVVYEETARAWTEAPATLSGLWRQRYRWSYGTMQAVWKHKGAVVSRDPRQRRIGRRALPYMIFFQVLLPALAPLIDVFALYGLIFLDPLPVIAYWAGFNLVQLALGAYAFRLDGESLRPLWAMPLQQFVYRQLMYLVVIESIVSALIGTRLRWQHLERTGEVEVAR